jgi:hypothetical protein
MIVKLKKKKKLYRLRDWIPLVVLFFSTSSMGFFLSNSLCRTGGITVASKTQPVIDHLSNKPKQNKNTKPLSISSAAAAESFKSVERKFENILPPDDRCQST